MNATAPPTTRPIPPRQLAWLQHELTDWTSAGIIDDTQAARISTRYRTGGHARLSLGRILLVLGGGFVGIGLIWLVAANLDQLSPLVRFLAITLIWLAFLTGGELLASRTTSPAVVGSVRLLAALGFGAVVFQAAQSLQVPAFEPRLVGAWAAGALLHGCLARAYLPFLVGVLGGLYWWMAQPLWTEPSALSVVVVLGAGAVLASALAVLHDRRLERFARLWRLVGAGLALATMFVAAIPGIGGDAVEWSAWLVAELVAAGLALLLVAATRFGPRALEPAGAVAVLVVSVLLAQWDTGTDTARIGADDWAHAALSVAAYVVLAVAVVAVGQVRDHAALTAVAMVALVVFTTFQSFAVFAQIVTGAWLFVVLGTVFLGTGFLFDRARRELAQALDNDSPTATDGAPR